MDQVKEFNTELSSILECRPPISKAKMTAVTKGALKAIKYYKHVVQSVEKFVQKCKPEYKVPGLYVVDSIVRQSRHQHGADNDVFAPRFAKNLKVTVQHLFKCPEDQRSKVVRVLNLWQKNKVFTSDVIQPLLDLAHPNAIETQEESDQQVMDSGEPLDKTSWGNWNDREKHQQPDVSNEQLATVEAILQHSQLAGIDLTKMDAQSLNNLQQLANQITGGRTQENVKFNKKLLDFDYGDEDEEETGGKDEENSSEPASLVLSMAQNLLSNPELIKQLQQMQQTIQQTEALKNELNATEELHREKLRQEDDFGQQMHVSMPQVQPAVMENMQNRSMPDVNQPPSGIPNFIVPNYPQVMNHAVGPTQVTSSLSGPFSHDPHSHPDVIVLEGEGGKDVDLRRREREKSRSPQSRYKRRRYSGSPPRDRRRRSRSRSRSNRYRRDNKSRSRSRDREREKERERRKKGLPPMRKNFLNVCSTTLWLGHVPKTVPESEIHDVFGEFGTVLTIDIIPPRGCAYVCMDRRQDAYRALQKLRNLKLQGSSIKMAWAPGKGMKGKQFKDYWEVELGVSCIPHEKIPDDVDLDLLEDGGMFDEETLPARLKERIDAKSEKGSNLRKMNATDLLALVEAQAPATPSTTNQVAANANVVPTVNSSNIPGMPTVVPQTFAGLPNIPLPGHPMMMPPNFQGGIRPMMVLPPSTQQQLMPNPAFSGGIVGSLPLVVPSNPGLINHPALLPQPLIPPISSAESLPPTKTKNDGQQLSNATSNASSFDQLLKEVKKKGEKPSLLGDRPQKNLRGDDPNVIPLASVNVRFRPPFIDGGARNMRNDFRPNLNEPMRFPGMRFNSPRMPRMMHDSNPRMRMMGRRPPFNGNPMRGERPWMNKDPASIGSMGSKPPPLFPNEADFYPDKPPQREDRDSNGPPRNPRFEGRERRWKGRSRWEAEPEENSDHHQENMGPRDRHDQNRHVGPPPNRNKRDDNSSDTHKPTADNRESSPPKKEANEEPSRDNKEPPPKNEIVEKQSSNVDAPKIDIPVVHEIKEQKCDEPVKNTSCAEQVPDKIPSDSVVVENVKQTETTESSKIDAQ